MKITFLFFRLTETNHILTIDFFSFRLNTVQMDQNCIRMKAYSWHNCTGMQINPSVVDFNYAGFLKTILNAFYFMFFDATCFSYVRFFELT